MAITVREGSETAKRRRVGRVPLPRIVVLLWVWSAALLALTVVVGWVEQGWDGRC